MEHVEVGLTLAMLGNSYALLGDRQRQVEVQERTLAIFEAHYGPQHMNVARILHNLGIAYGDLGSRSKRIELQDRAAVILEAWPGAE
eukprot:6168455-Amphidinium_carterae.1